MEQLFDIFRIDAPKAIEMAATADAPGAHDFEELIIGILLSSVAPTRTPGAI